MIKTITPRFKPRPYQEQLFREAMINKKKRFLRILHRRAGKDHEAFNLMWMMAIQKVGLYFYLLPVIHQANTVIWQGRGKGGVSFLDYIPKELIEKVNHSTMRIHLINGSIIRVTGSDNFEALIGSNPLGIVFSEYQSSNPMAWDLLRPILAENDGWVLFNGTSRGHNHLYELYEKNKDNPKWFVSLMTANDTKLDDGSPVIVPSVIEDEREAGMPEELILQEFYCSFEAAIRGAYYAKELTKMKEDNRFCLVPIDKYAPVHTAWDLGMRDATAIGFFQAGKDGFLHMVDCIGASGFGADEWVVKIIELQKKRKFLRWGMHFLPHDVRVKEWGSGRTRVEILQKAGITPRIVGNHSIVDRIQAVRSLLPRMKIDSHHCKDLFRCLQEYHSEYDEKRGIMSAAPVHNWASHAADMFGYFAMGYLENYDNAQLLKVRKYAKMLP